MVPPREGGEEGRQRSELPVEPAAHLDARGVELRDATGAALEGESLDATPARRLGRPTENDPGEIF